MLMSRITNQSWQRSDLQKSILNYTINRHKKDGFIVECELKSKGKFKYYELRKYIRHDMQHKKLIVEKLFFDLSGNSQLSNYTINGYNLYNN